MPELLLELFSEEIPARFQRRAAEDLKKAVTDALVEAGLLYEGATAFVTPRRLALTVAGIPARSPDLKEEKKGPRVGAPQPAIDGFLKSAGPDLDRPGQDRLRSQEGRLLRRRWSKRRAPTRRSCSPTILPRVIDSFPWPKSMQWGHGGLTWVRPIRAITATFGTENEEPEVIPFRVDDRHRRPDHLRPPLPRARPRSRCAASTTTSTALESAKVVLDLDRRKDIIRADAEHLAFAQGLTRHRTTRACSRKSPASSNGRW